MCSPVRAAFPLRAVRERVLVFVFGRRQVAAGCAVALLAALVWTWLAPAARTRACAVCTTLGRYCIARARAPCVTAAGPDRGAWPGGGAFPAHFRVKEKRYVVPHLFQTFEIEVR